MCIRDSLIAAADVAILLSLVGLIPLLVHHMTAVGAEQQAGEPVSYTHLHGWQSQQSCLWKQTVAGRTPGQGQRTGRAVSLWEW